MLPAVLILSAVLLAQADPDARYRGCIEQVGRDPAAALAAADRWAGEGGGPLAAHCRGNALMALGRFREAAETLDALIGTMAEAAPPVAARIALQAGRAWARAGERDRSLAALDRAAALAPADTAVRLERGVLRAMAGALFEAVDDFNAVLDREPENVRALVLRASTYRRLDTLELALDDLSRALALRPEEPDALLERGLVHAIRGDDAAARSDWRRVMAAAPDSAAAQLSREYLAELGRGGG